MTAPNRFQEDRIEKLLCSDGKERQIHIWEPEKPRMLIIAVHGLMDHGGALGVPGLFFKAKDIALVAHDQHGHDHHGPDLPHRVYFPNFEVFLDDLDLMLEWVKKEFPGLPVYVMAHSMGSLVATHWGIKHLKDNPLVKGFILSSPYYVNSVKVSPLLIKMAGLLAALVPRWKLPTDDFRDVVTHDKEMKKRQEKDEAEGYMIKESAMRIGDVLLKAQNWIPDHISQWKHPLLAIIAVAG